MRTPERFRFRVSDLRELARFEVADTRDFEVYYPASLSRPRDNAVVFIRNTANLDLAKLGEVRECVILVPEGEADRVAALRDANLVLPVHNPRLEYARLVAFALESRQDTRSYRQLPTGAVVGEGVRLGENVLLEPGAFVDHDVEIGDGTVVRSGARIRRYVSIGNRTLIRENCVVGSDGFGFERETDGTPVRIPHLGGVEIGSHVEIGALTTVVSGTVDPTLIEDHVKTDDHVHIAHNCHIGRGALLTACTELSGRVNVGEYAWLGPNCSVTQGVQIGERSVVGIGAVVLKAVEPESTVAGNPAVTMAELRTFSRARQRLLSAVDEGRL